METIDNVLAFGAGWYAKLTSAVATIKGVWTAAAAVVARHPELESDVHDAFVDVVNGLRTKSPTAILAVVSDVKKAYTDFTVAYVGERQPVLDLIAKLKALAN